MKDNDLRPDQVVIDVILRWTDGMPKIGEATIKQGALIMCGQNHLGKAVTLSFPVNFDGEPREGDDPRFIIFGIWPRVWKVAPSVKHELLHGFVTIVGCPEVSP